MKTMSINTLYSKLEEGSLTSVELVADYFKRAKQLNREINAYISFDQEAYLVEQAAKIDRRRQNGEKLSKLAGLPIGIKDNLLMNRLPTTAASKLLKDFYQENDAAVCTTLQEAGAITLGKLNMDEFAMGSSNESSYFGKVHNPIHKDYVPGGSSGGSTAAVAADMAVFSLGTDTGGSIRQPAAYCGTVGMKPTYGSVSRYGLIDFAPSFDQIGAVTKNIEDMAIVMQHLIGYDARDARSRNYTTSKPLEQYLGESIKGVKVALPKEYFAEGLDAQVKEAVLRGAEILEREGAEVEEVSIPFTQYLVPVYYGSTSVEAYEELLKYTGGGISTKEKIDKRSEGFGKQVKKRMLLGAYFLQEENRAYYERILEGRKYICQRMNQLLSQYPIILAPTAPSIAFKFGEKQSTLEMYLSDIYTVTANIAGIPALSLPIAKGIDDMPIGIQLMAGRGAEGMLLQVSHALECNL